MQGNVEVTGNIISTPDGGYAICGGVSLPSPGPSAFLVKLDPSGQVQWIKTYRYNNLITVARQVLVMPDSGYMILGNVRITAQNEDMLLIRTDSLGNMMWSRTYGNSANDYANAIDPLPSGNYILSGSSVIGTTRAAVIRIDPSGNVLGTNYSTSVFASPNMKARISGPNLLCVSGSFVTQMFTDTSGIYSGQVDIQMAGSGNSTDALVTSTGRCVSVGNMDVGSPSGEKVFLLLSDSMGSVTSVNNVKLGVQGGLVKASAVLDPGNGQYVMAGHINASAAAGSGLFLAKFDSVANLVWSRRYFPVNTVYYTAGGAMHTADGGYICSGMVYFGSQSDLVVIKTDSAGFSGCNESNQIFDVTAPLYFAATELGPFAGPAVISTPPFPVSVFANSGVGTVPCSSTSVSEPLYFGELAVYPNPVTDELSISLPESIVDAAQIRILNLAGQLVFQSESSERKLGISGLSAGLYFLDVRSASGRIYRTRFVKQ